MQHPVLENVQQTSATTSPNHSIENDNSSADDNYAHLHATITKSKLKILHEKSEKLNKFKKIVNTKYTSFSSPLSRSFIATGLSSAPGLSHSSATTLFACTVQALLIEFGLCISPEKIVAACPGKDAFARILEDEAADILSIVRNRLQDKPIFFSCNGANKATHHVIKMISFWFNNRVITFLLDSDAAVGTNISTAEAIDSSLRKIDKIDSSRNISKVIISGLCTDARGDGTREGLALELHKLQHSLPIDIILVTTCILHTMNQMMQSLYEKYLGSGGVSSRNCMQLYIPVMYYKKNMRQVSGIRFGWILMTYSLEKCFQLQFTPTGNILVWH